VLFVSLALYDLKYKILPNSLTYLSIFFSVVFVGIFFFHYSDTSAYFLSRLLGVVFSFGIFYLIFQASSGKWIGGGDVKLCIALGLLLGGPLKVILMIFLASFGGSIISLGLLTLKKVNSKLTIAFGPLLISSTFLCFFFGTQIISWYTKIAG
jgi:leader peptidase (prepilin peptidase)/N-methyltransferase